MTEPAQTEGPGWIVRGDPDQSGPALRPKGSQHAAGWGSEQRRAPARPARRLAQPCRSQRCCRGAWRRSGRRQGAPAAAEKARRKAAAALAVGTLLLAGRCWPIASSTRLLALLWSHGTRGRGGSGGGDAPHAVRAHAAAACCRCPVLSRACWPAGASLRAPRAAAIAGNPPAVVGSASSLAHSTCDRQRVPVDDRRRPDASVRC